MRNSIDGLATAVQNKFKLTPTTNAIFIFCNETRDKLKILEWDGDGFWLHYKKLQRGRFPWPQQNGEEKTMTLSERELEYLLENEKLKLRLDRIDFTGRPVA